MSPFSPSCHLRTKLTPSRAGVLLGLLVLTFAFIVYRRHTRIYGTPQMPSVELRRVSSYVSVFTRRQNAELGARDQGPGYSAPPYSAQPPPYVGPEPEGELDRKRGGGAEYDADVPAKHANASVDVVDAQGMYEYDVPPPPPSPRTVSSSSTPPPPPTPPNERVGRFCVIRERRILADMAGYCCFRSRTTPGTRGILEPQ